MREEAALMEATNGPVSRETFLKLKVLQNLFEKWASRINLVASSTLCDIWSRHVLDSAQLIGLRPACLNWLDLGSGGGFPGLVVAVLLEERNGRIDLVESNRKKAAFLQTACTSLKLPARIHPIRIESAPDKVAMPEVVTARALAALPALLDLSSPWLLEGAAGLFHKGRGYRQEIGESAARWAFDLVEHSSKVDPEGVILEISGLSALADRRSD